MSDREKLAREMRAAASFVPEVTAERCADIAIAYADRRVAEAVERAAVEAWNTGMQWHSKSGDVRGACSAAAGRIRALSPAREGGE